MFTCRAGMVNKKLKFWAKMDDLIFFKDTPFIDGNAFLSSEKNGDFIISVRRMDNLFFNVYIEEEILDKVKLRGRVVQTQRKGFPVRVLTVKKKD